MHWPPFSSSGEHLAEWLGLPGSDAAHSARERRHDHKARLGLAFMALLFLAAAFGWLAAALFAPAY